MFDLKEFEQGQDSNLSQIILLDDKGNILGSSNTLFSTDQLKGSAIDTFPILETIYDSKVLFESKKEIHFKRVQTSFSLLPGYYDFKFLAVEFNQQNFILWNIDDLTDLYSIFQKHQQQKNEIELSIENIKFFQDEAYGGYLKDKEKLTQLLDLSNFNYSKAIKISLDFEHNPVEGFDHLITELIKSETESSHQRFIEENMDAMTNVIVEIENLTDILNEKKIPFQRKNYIQEILLDAIQTLENKYSKRLNIDLDIDINHFTSSIDQPQFLNQLFNYCIVNSYNDHLQSDVKLELKSISPTALQIKVLKSYDQSLFNELTKEHLQNISLQIFLYTSLVKMLVKYYEGTIAVSDNSAERFSIIIELPMRQTEAASL